MKTRANQRILSVLLALVMVLALSCALSLFAAAEGETTGTVTEVSSKEDFIKAVQTNAADGNTVKLLTNIELDENDLDSDSKEFEISQSITLDLNGYDITQTATNKDAIVIENGANVTITGTGTITGNWQGVSVKSGASLTVDGNVTFVATENNGIHCNGSAVINNGRADRLEIGSMADAVIINGGSVGEVTLNGGCIVDKCNALESDKLTNVGAKIIRSDSVTYCYSFSGAIAAAESGDTVALSESLNLYRKLAVPGGKKITIDIGEYYIKWSDSEYADVENYIIELATDADVTITGTGTITGNNNGIYVPSGATLTVKGVTIKATVYNGIYNMGTTIVESGNLLSDGKYHGIYTEGTLTVNGGTVNTLYIGAGNVTVNGGTIAKNGEGDSFPADGGNLTITDGTIEGWISPALTTTISGGTFNGSVYANQITGGTFNGMLIMNGETPSVTDAVINGKFSWWSTTVPTVANVTFGANATIAANDTAKDTYDYTINAERNGIEKKVYYTVTVNFEEGGSYEATVNLNGTNVATRTGNKYTNAKAVAGDTYIITATIKAEEGYQFEGWYLNGEKLTAGVSEDGSLSYSFTVTEAVTLTAKFVNLDIENKTKAFFAEYDTCDSYEITTADEMQYLAYAVNTLGYDFSGKTVKLGNDINFTGVAYHVIGDADHPFKGTFDGQGNTISNITSVVAGTTNIRVGLFGQTVGATVKNLVLINCEFDGTASGYAGGIVADATNTLICDSTIRNVSTSGWFSGAVLAHTYGGVTVRNVTVIGCAASGAKGGAVAGYTEGITIEQVSVSDVKDGAALIGHANAGNNVIDDVTVDAPDAVLIGTTYSDSVGNITFTGENTKITAAGIVGDAETTSNKTITVKDGTYTTDGTTKLDVSEYLEDTKKQNDDGSIKEAVAMVNGVKYETLAEAYEAVADGGTITLVADCEAERINLEDKSITVVLNGHTLTSTSVYGVMFCAKNGRKITIDGTVAGSKLVGTLMITADTYGHIEINGGTYENSKYCPVYVNGAVSNNESIVRITDATITYLSGSDPDQDMGVGVYLAGYSTAEFTDTTITAPVTGIEIRAGKLTLNNCTVTGGNGEVEASANGNGSTVNNAALAISQHATKKDIEVIINGGTFTATAAIYQSDVQGTGSANVDVAVASGTFNGTVTAQTDNTVAVSGGTFSEKLPDNVCARGYAPKANGSGAYEVIYAPIEVWTGYSGNASNKKVGAYATLEEALANRGEYTWLLINMDYTLTADFTIPAGVSIDIAGGVTFTVAKGVTLTVSKTANRLGVLKNATMINNGTIIVCGEDYTSGRVTVLGGTFDASTLSPIDDTYVIDKNGSNYFSAKAIFEITYADGSTKKAGLNGYSSLLEGAVKLTLLSDISNFAGSFNTTDKLGENFVFDLGGHTLSGKASATTQVLSINGVPMTIINGTIKYTSSNTGSGALYISADVTIDSTVTIEGGNGYAIWVDGYGHTLTVNGHLTTNGSYAITGNGSENGGNIAECNIIVNDGAVIEAPNGIGIYHPQLGTVTINGGRIEAHTGIQICAGKLVIKDGEIISNGADHDSTGSQNAILDGAAVSIINRNYPGGVPALEITGGTITANGAGALAVKAYDYTNEAVAEWTEASDYVAISGGSFSSAIDEDLCADGFIPSVGEDGTYGVKEGVYVAEVNGKKYETVAEAINAASDGDTVTLLADATEDVVIDKSITLDLGGKTLTNTNSGKATLTVAKGADAIIKNGSVIGGTSYYTIQNNGTARLTDVTATAGNTGSSMLDNWGTLTIGSGTYTGGLNVVKSEEGSVLEISGGSFTLDYALKWKYNAVILVYGTTTITGGTFIQNAKTASAYPQVIMTGVVDGYEAKTTVTGGIFENNHSSSNNYIFRGLGKATSANFEVSGGTFNKAVSDGYFVTGFIAVKNSDGTYRADGPYVAKVNNTGYDSLADAIAAANAGNTVTLLVDTTEDVIIDKKLILDLGGHTLINTNNGKATLTINAGVTATVKNGTILGGNSYYTILNNGTATFSDLVATAGNTGSSMLDNAGTLTIKSGTYTGGMDTIKNEPNAALTIKGGTFSTDYAENNAHTGVVYNLGNLEITGGTFTHTAISAPAWAYPHVIMTASENGVKPSTVIKGGTFTSTLKTWKATVLNYDGAGSADSTKVSGGVFNMKIDEDYCADGFIPTQKEDGTYGVKEGSYVARINGVGYETLAEAIAAASDGQTVVVVADITVDEPIEIRHSITLDLGTYTVAFSGTKVDDAQEAFQIVSTAGKSVIFTITGTTGKVTSSYGVVNIYTNNCGFVLEGGTLESSKGTTVGIYGMNAYYNDDYSEVSFNGLSDGKSITINGGHIIAHGGNAIHTGGLGTNNKLTVSGGEITVLDGGTGFYLSTGTKADISDAVITVTGGTAIFGTNDAEISMDNVTVTSDNKLINVNGDVRLGITGGTFTCSSDSDWTLRNTIYGGDDNITISGGTFSVAVKEGYCADGFIPTQKEDGTYGVKAGQYVARINGVGYETLAEAIAAASDGQTVVVVADITITAPIDIDADKSIILDLGGMTLTSDTAEDYYAIGNMGTLTVKDSVGGGKIVANCDYGIINEGILIIESGTVQAEYAAVCASGGSTTTINGGTFISTDDYYGLYADNDAEAAATVIVTDGNFVSGVYNGVDNDLISIAISGGTFATAIREDYCADGFIPSKNEDGTYGVKEGSYVARINGVGYETIEEAFAAAQSGDTVTLVANVNMTATIRIEDGKKLTLALNGFDVTITETGKFFRVCNGEFTVTGDGTIKEQNPYFAPIILKGGPAGSVDYTVVNIGAGVTLEGWAGVMIDQTSGTADNYGMVFNVENATLRGVDDTSGASGTALYVNGVVCDAKINLTDATLTATGTAMYLAGYAETTVNGGTVKGDLTGIEIRAGKLTLNNCDVIGGTGELKATADGNGSTVNNAALAISQHTTVKDIEVIINGGTFTATAAVYQTDVQGTGSADVKTSVKDGTFNGIVKAETTGAVAVSGGTFDNALDESVCADGFLPRQNADGTYGVAAVVIVTVTSDPDNSGILSGGGRYAEGTKVTLVARAVTDFTFLGWYDKDGVLVSEDRVYTFTATADASYTARFKSDAKRKLTVSVGHGEVDYTYENADGITTDTWENDISDNLFARGTRFTVTAKPLSGYTFLYWINADGRILSEETTYSFWLGDNMKLTACYRKTEGAKPYVIFRDLNDKILQAGDATGGYVTVPAHNTFAGFTFLGWFDENGNELVVADGKIAVTGNLTVYARYKANDGLTVTVNGTLSAETYSYGDKVTVLADATKDGKYFSGWYIGSMIVSDRLEYTFYVTGSVELEARYEGDAPLVQQPMVVMILSDRQTTEDGNQTVSFNVSFSVPEGYSISEVGLLRTLSASRKDSLVLANVDGTFVKKNSSILTGDTGTYAYTLTLAASAASRNVYAVGYLICKDQAGNILTLYTPVFTSAAQ